MNTRVAPLLVAVLILGALPGAPGPALGEVLCASHQCNIRLREACRRYETVVDVWALEASTPDAVPLGPDRRDALVRGHGHLRGDRESGRLRRDGVPVTKGEAPERRLGSEREVLVHDARMPRGDPEQSAGGAFRATAGLLPVA